MKVRLVGHASIAVQCRGITILCDPWFVGKVFNNGWALVSPASPPSYSDVDYIWISHEHPDHFNFPTLKSIPPEERARIPALYQRHASARIPEALLKLGFQSVNELPLYRWYHLCPGVEVYCGSVGSMDSFLAVRDSQECVLNINDCILNADQLRYIKRCIGKVSLLCTQFSFAAWVGNERDEREGAEGKIEQLRQQIEVLQPEYTVPTASFAYFCNKENCRMNAWVNTPDTIARLQLRGVNFMYPGDEWDSESKTFDDDGARAKYRADYANFVIEETPEAVDISTISRAVEQRLHEIRSKMSKIQLKQLEPITIYVHDLGQMVVVDPAGGTYRVMEADAKQCQAARFVMCAQVAWFFFAFPWGPASTESSGMYLDRAFATGYGWNSFFRVQNRISTEVIRFGTKQESLRTVKFLWDKKGEIFYRFTGMLRGQQMVED